VATNVNTVTTPPTANTYLIVTGFTGIIPVGTGQTFTSLTNPSGIFEAINNGALTGNVTLDIVTDLTAETGTHALNQWAEDGVGNYTMLIKPNGAPRLVTGTNAGALIRINGADRVRIDGSTAATRNTNEIRVVGGNPALRELTFQNTNTGTSAVVIAVQSGTAGAQNNTLINLIVLGQDPTTTLGGITLGGATPGTAGTDNDNNRIENCAIRRVIYGLYSSGQNTANPNSGSVIAMNDLAGTGADRVRRVGIVLFFESGAQIIENNIGGIDTNESADAIGIGIGAQGIDATLVATGGVTNTLVTRNRINGVNSQSATGFSAAGIAVAGGSGGLNVVTNNMISGVISPATSPDLVAGIFVAGVTGSSTRVGHNSVSMSGDRGAVATQTPSFALAISGIDPTVEVKDNAFATTQTASGGGVNARSFAIGVATTTFANLDANFNDYFTSGANAGFFRSGSLAAAAGTDYATVALWGAAIGDDTNSLEVDPQFISATDLHLLANSPLIAVGTPLTGVTIDIDSEARSATTPTIGADEVLADLSITKTDGVTTATPGTTNVYTIVAANAGPANSTATVTDTFPATLTCNWTCVGAGGGTCSASGVGNLSDSVTLPAGGSVTYTAMCSISAGATGSLVNTATVSGAAADPVPANNSATDTDTLVASADLAITKTDGVTTATPGQSTTYTIVASNAGPSNTTATITDTFPASLTCTWTCVGAGGGTCTAAGSGNLNDAATLPAGGSVTYTASCTISAAATGTLVNTATVSGAATDPVPGNNSATDSDTLTPSANVGITKTDGVTTATPGGSTTYTITASNAGPSNTAATVADTFPASLTCTWTCVGAGGGTCTAAGSGNINNSVTLPAGGSVTYSATCGISPAATGTLTNTATVTGVATDPVPGNNTATDVNTLVPSANLGITKTDGVTTVTAGGSTTYTITASNAGPSNTTGTVADTFPATLTCTWTCVGAGGGTCTASGSGNINDAVTLPSGGSVTYTASCTISGAATGTLVNTATVTGAATDPVPGNNSATDTDSIGASADLSITKTDGVTTVTAGGSTTYTITASNAGPSGANGSTIADTFPASLTCTWTCVGAAGGTCTASGSGNIADTVNLPSGGSVTYTASCTISAAATGSLTNTATVTAPGGTTDPNPANNSATDVDTITGNGDLSITKTDGVASVTAGGSTTYTITAANAGPSTASGATLADTFPASLTCTWTCVGAGGGSCSASGSGNIADNVNLPAGGSVTYTAACAISAAATGSLTNTATITAPGGFTDPTPGNNSATDVDTIGISSDLSITKTDGVAAITAGGTTTYTITAANAGPSNATGANLADVFPATLTCTWTCVGAGGGTCTASGSGNINDTVNLPTGGNVTYSAVCAVSAAATGTVVNTATVTAPAGASDPNPANNSATDTDTVTASADLSITKTDGVTTVTAGTSTTYVITASNAGPSNAAGVTVTDTFPASLTCTWTCVGAGGGTCTASGSGNIGDTTNLPAGASVTYTAICALSTSATGTLTNTATVTAPGGVTDPNPANNSATDADTIAPPLGSTLTGTKSVSGVFTRGSQVTYTITVTNAGPGAQADNPGDEFVDVLPAGLTLSNATASAGTATTAGNTVRWNGGLAASGTVTITITALINANAAGQIVNQGTVFFDGDGNGTNDASATTDDPGLPGNADGTGFIVLGTNVPVPALDRWALLLLITSVLGFALAARRLPGN